MSLVIFINEFETFSGDTPIPSELKLKIDKLHDESILFLNQNCVRQIIHSVFMIETEKSKKIADDLRIMLQRLKEEIKAECMRQIRLVHKHYRSLIIDMLDITNNPFFEIYGVV